MNSKIETAESLMKTGRVLHNFICIRVGIFSTNLHSLTINVTRYQRFQEQGPTLRVTRVAESHRDFSCFHFMLNECQVPR